MVNIAAQNYDKNLNIQLKKNFENTLKKEKEELFKILPSLDSFKKDSKLIIENTEKLLSEIFTDKSEELKIMKKIQQDQLNIIIKEVKKNADSTQLRLKEEQHDSDFIKKFFIETEKDLKEFSDFLDMNIQDYFKKK